MFFNKKYKILQIQIYEIKTVLWTKESTRKIKNSKDKRPKYKVITVQNNNTKTTTK